MNKEMDPKKQMEQQLNKMGYVHPDSSNTHRSVYKAYSTSGDNVYKSKSSSGVYRTESNAYKDSEESVQICPTCKSPALYVCSCTEYGDMMCSNKHYWYVVDGKTKIGDPHAHISS